MKQQAVDYIRRLKPSEWLKVKLRQDSPDLYQALKNCCYRLRPYEVRLKRKIFSFLLRFQKIKNINGFEFKVYSENSEDGILNAIFYKIGTENKFFVEFGVGDGSECNSRLLREQGWDGLWMDAGPAAGSGLIKKEFITAENINYLFEKYNIPENFDLLSIDIDGNDYWVWKSLDNKYRPRVVVIEYNAKYPPSESRVIKYEPDFAWKGTDYLGASLLALKKLGTQKGYFLVGCDKKGVNAFFVINIQIDKFSPRSIEKLYRPPRYGRPEHNFGHPPDARTLIEV